MKIMHSRDRYTHTHIHTHRQTSSRLFAAFSCVHFVAVFSDAESEKFVDKATIGIIYLGAVRTQVRISVDRDETLCVMIGG